MSWYIEEVVTGERPTLLAADLANQLIKALNMLGNMTIEKGTSDSVVYEDGYGINFQYGIGGDFQYTGDISLLDGSDLTSRYVFSFMEGELTDIQVKPTGYVWKTVELCEDGATTSYEFLVKS